MIDKSENKCIKCGKRLRNWVVDGISRITCPSHPDKEKADGKEKSKTKSSKKVVKKGD